MIVIDASVYVAILKSDEPHHAASRRWYLKMLTTAEPLAAPFPFLAEVAGAISRTTNEFELAQIVIGHLQAQKIIELVPVSINLGQHAAEISAAHRLRGCDALYVALARQLGAELITLDQEQLARAAAVVPTRQP